MSVQCENVDERGNFLNHFDVVVSAGRGVMEALACGLPAPVAGFDYGGPVLPDNIERHLEVNMTGFSMGHAVSSLGEDLRQHASLDGHTCRRMAEDYCSIDSFLNTLAIGIA